MSNLTSISRMTIVVMSPTIISFIVLMNLILIPSYQQEQDISNLLNNLNQLNQNITQLNRDLSQEISTLNNTTISSLSSPTIIHPPN